ncbi:MAG: amidohydrolase [Xanthobacteraceae bacterium]|nr:amidohydrolase [Xanthobacteraceae bacterium]
MTGAVSAATVATSATVQLAQAQGTGGGAAGKPAEGPAAPVAPPASAAAAAKVVAQSRDAILRISREVWALGEVSLSEVKSAQVHVRELQAAGFRITSTGTAGVPTAFVAEWSQGTGGPVIAYLPEYDALPALGNAAEPRQAPGPTPDGHGCGHNMIGAGCTGAAFALKRMMESARTPGTIRVYGCAAEETEGAKVYMVRAGLFNDVDAALAWHPAPFAGTGMVRMNATNNVKVAFRGRTAHAGNTPWEGRSALKAAELFGAGIQYMREHILPTARLHYIYENAGVAPNVVPEFAQVWITIRDIDRDKVNAMTDWIRQIADGAALMTQTKAEFDLFFGMYDLMPNQPLVDLAYRHLVAVPLEWTAEEQAFARACQKAMGVPEAGMSTRVLPRLPDTTAGGSTDIGDISYTCPVGVFAWPTVPLGIGLHTWPVTACGGMSIGDKSSLVTAQILAAMGFDLMNDRALLDAAKADLKKRRGDKPFVSPLPPARTHPLGLPPFLRRQGTDEVFGGVVAG